MPWEVEHIGPHTLYRGDCLEVLPTLGEVDAVITDPPYGIHFSTNRGFASWNQSEIEGDDSTALRDHLLSLVPDASALVFGSWKVSHPPGTHTVLIWDKGDAAGMGNLRIPWKPNHEEIYVLGSGFDGHRGSGVLRYNNISWETHGRAHPNAKPVALLMELMRKVTASRILDPFMGSGTTGVACVQLGRLFTGIEIERQYFDIACQRLHDAMAQPDLFVPPPAPVQQRLFAGVAPWTN